MQVELIQHASVWAWLTPALQFIGTLVLFAGSMIVLWRTNKSADRRAEDSLHNERARDFRLWQRDTLLRLGSEVVDASIHAHDEAWQMAHKLNADLEPADATAFEAAGRRIGASIAQLGLIGAHTPADRCREMRYAINDPRLMQSVAEYNAVLRLSQRAAGSIESATGTIVLPHKRAQLDSALNAINEARAAFCDAVVTELERTNEDYINGGAGRIS